MTMKYIIQDGSGEEVRQFNTPGEAYAERLILSDKNPMTSYTVKKVEKDDEQDDPETTMSYNFIADDEQEEQTTIDNSNEVGSMWTLGSHSTVNEDDQNELSKAIEDTIDSLDDEIDESMVDLLEDASDLMNDADIHRFECPVCGLGHSHADYKHDIREAFNVTNSFADQMEYCPYCHCGVNELSMLMEFYPYIDERVFIDNTSFEGVSEVDPQILEELYRIYKDEVDIDKAAGIVAVDQGFVEQVEIPLGIREDLEAYLARRKQIEQDANKAPIDSDVRNKITENRNELIEVISQ